MIYKNGPTRSVPMDDLNDEDVYTSDEKSTIVLWQWSGEGERYDQIQITSVADMERLIKVLMDQVKNNS